MSNKLQNTVTTRCFEVMQYLYHPDHLERDMDGVLTGNLLPEFADDEPLITKEKAIEACREHATIKCAAIFEHSADVYIEDDEKKNPSHKAGWSKPTHLHIYGKSVKPLDINAIAKWFGVEPQYVEKKKGHGAFLDCLEYGFHESPKAIEQEKTHYDESAILYTKNCNPRAEVDALQKQIEQTGKRSLTPKQELRLKVVNGELTLKQAFEYDPLGYVDDIDKLQKCRATFLGKVATLPDHRFNFYICAKDSANGSGVGKTVLSKMLARALYPDIESSDEVYYVAGAGKVAFQDYDGQPVVIFSDTRAPQLIQTFGGRDQLFQALDLNPTKQPFDKKFGSLNLINKYTIIEGITSYEEFLDGLAGEYRRLDGFEVKAEDKKQAYRRFPIVIQVDLFDYEILVNKGFYNGTRDYNEYEEDGKYLSSVIKLSEKFGKPEDIPLEYQCIQVQPIVEKINEIESHLSQTDASDDSFLEDIGKPVSDDEILALKRETCNAICYRCIYGSHGNADPLKNCHPSCIEFVKQSLQIEEPEQSNSVSNQMSEDSSNDSSRPGARFRR